MTERREIEERHKKRIRNPNFGGRSNWDTYEAVNIIESDESNLSTGTGNHGLRISIGSSGREPSMRPRQRKHSGNTF